MKTFYKNSEGGRKSRYKAPTAELLTVDIEVEFALSNETVGEDLVQNPF